MKTRKIKAYKHKKSGKKPYFVLSEFPFKIQYNNEWENSIFYTNLDDEVFIRSKKEFNEKFEEYEEVIVDEIEDDTDEFDKETENYLYYKETIEELINEIFCEDNEENNKVNPKMIPLLVKTLLELYNKYKN